MDLKLSQMSEAEMDRLKLSQMSEAEMDRLN